MKLYRTFNLSTLTIIFSLGLGFQSASAAAIHLCWESFDGDEFETIDLYFTAVAPGTFSIAGKSYVTGANHNASNLGIVVGSAVVEDGQVIGYLGINGTEPEANGLFFVGQLRFELDLSTAIMTTELIGSSYGRDTMTVVPEYSTDTLNFVTCPL